MNRLQTCTLLTLLATTPSSLFAQDTGSPPRLMRGDVSGTVAWVNTNKEDLTYDRHNDWRSQGAFSLGAGWYWTDHHQTRVEVSGTTETTFYSAVPVTFVGGQSFLPVQRSFESRRLSVTQHYQFRRNEWVHPFLGGGVDFVRERESRKDDPVFAYDPITRQSRLVRAPVQHGAHHENSARGVLTAGVKAYMSRKVFALTDLRVSIGSRRTEDVQWRFGLGADF
jgi:opacity protein-like surface antigen